MSSSSLPNGVRVEFLDSILSISQEEWDSVSDSKNPFLEYGFLSSLEESRCIGNSTAWESAYCVFWKDGVFGGAVPFFKKYDSYGEYIFDFQWAQFYAQSGLRYYPKGLASIPFTPANGKRILHSSQVSLEEAASILIPELIRFSEDAGLSGIHFLFLESEEAEVLRKYGFVTRLSHQYHWKNRNYADFNDFLADFKSKKRMQIKREREIVRGYGLNIRILEGDQIQKKDMDSIWNFYSDTHSRKWGSAYLNRHFFDLAWERLRDRLVLVLADRNGSPIAGTFNLRKGEFLYGRYWGCVEYLPHLHFECCFYRLIEYAIEKKLRLFEAGAQGEHKFLRGFPAVPTFSSHLIFHPGARNAIERFLKEERLHMQEMIEETNVQSPLRESPIDPLFEDDACSEKKERNL
ncbi:GNAT family N-acetyltransferase [Leptospira ellisii]|uniref:GNAT family N-acetyltransferase n=1 Tax=Leptospira ellisii TaxID=2023197 RepID=A0A2N0B951_9LEPT|nr:GNAT family N-acetyltransferase [Leptospira ellisii]MDV6234981.1 GNAT family N-acetyltransferase [Leptospira ellisii]PJZ93071.1 GNAT family N-acetyltransferase [Leptospira ellisii]